MAAVVIKWHDWESILFGGFHVLLEDEILCDTILMGCDGHSRTAHSCVLAAASPVLKHELTTKPHTDKYDVCISSISGHVWQLILQFLYNGKIDLNNRLEADCVIKAAVELDILQLQLVAEQYLMTEDNADVKTPESMTNCESSTAKVEDTGAEVSVGNHTSDVEDSDTVCADIHTQVDRSDTVMDSVITNSVIGDTDITSSCGHAEVEMQTANVKRETIEHFAEGRPDDAFEQDATPATGCESGNKTPATKRGRKRKHKSVSSGDVVMAEDKYKCGVCPQTFPSKTLLVKHTPVHRKNGKWPCTDCDKVYLRRHTLIIHRRKHTGDRPYKCSMCDSRFIRTANLKDHERIHSVEKPFKCRFCSFYSKWRTTVSNHENVTHFGLRPFKCDICGDTFTKRVGLDKHKLLHTGEKPFVCGTCGHAFVQRCTWREHERRHWATKPFSCSHCGREFVTRRSLLAHERGHTGDRPFLCAFCGSTFTTRSILQSHQRRHTEGKTPHPCPQCPKMYAKKRTLSHHLSKVHGVIAKDDVRENITDKDLDNVADVTVNPTNND